MSLKVISLFSQVTRPRNWSNQELAEFYRVEASLGRAGIAVETEQGLSDEGEPWFIFCRPETGDVIIHFARIDGLYVVASPAFGSCVRGRDFRTLIEGLMEQHPVVVPREKEKGKFFIHPAALLVALVTTAFFKLCQGDALAAESDHAQPATLLGGSVGSSSQRAAASAQSQMITLDERSAAILMVAVAVAVAWEQVTGTTDSVTFSTHAAQPDDLQLTLASLDRGTPVPHASPEAAGSQPTHAATFEQTPSETSSAPTQVVTVFSTPQAKIEIAAPTAKSADGDDSRPVKDSVPVPGTSESAVPPASHHVAQAAPEHAAPQAQPAEQQPAPPEVAHSSAALVEVKAIVGDLLLSHLANDNEAEQQTVLTLLNSITSLHGASESLQLLQVDASSTIALQPASATAATEPAFTAVVAAAAPTVLTVEEAIHQFMTEHSDFQIIKLEHEVIIYDPSLSPSNVKDAEQESFTFDDGSSVFLIGLPHHAPSVLGV